MGGYAESIQKFFIVVTLLVIGSIMVYKIRVIDMHTIFAMSKVLIPAIIIMGFLGGKIGSIVDNPKNKADADYKSAVLNALKRMDKSMTLQELNDKLTKTVAEPDAPDEVNEEDLDV
ncbi:MAG: hypothetical protein MJ231_03245 [bacterium]|nr:hypothetical protein [bacterium]